MNAKHVMKFHIASFVFVLLFLFPLFCYAISPVDMLGLKTQLDFVRDEGLVVGNMVIQLVVSFLSILLIIKIIRRSQKNDKVVKGDGNVAAFVEHKKFTLTPNARYGSSYNRQKYKNQVYDDLYTHAEFVEYSARLHEREVEFLEKQKEDNTLSEDQNNDLDERIKIANQRIAEFENEQEYLQEQMQYLSSSESEHFDDFCPHGLLLDDDCVECEERF